LKRGNEFLKPMIILEQSKVEGVNNIKEVQSLLERGENVVILSNHQTEADPQVKCIYVYTLTKN
jgi:glycerol-3-phosphate O-acyltransferase